MEIKISFSDTILKFLERSKHFIEYVCDSKKDSPLTHVVTHEHTDTCVASFAYYTSFGLPDNED